MRGIQKLNLLPKGALLRVSVNPFTILKLDPVSGLKRDFLMHNLKINICIRLFLLTKEQRIVKIFSFAIVFILFIYCSFFVYHFLF